MTTGRRPFFVGPPTLSSTHFPSPRQVMVSPAATGLSGFWHTVQFTCTAPFSTASAALPRLTEKPAASTLSSRRDDTVRFTDLVSLQETAAVKLDEQPMLLRAAGENVVVIAAKSGRGVGLRRSHIYLFREQQLVDTLTLPQEARAGDMDECGLLVVRTACGAEA